MYIKALEKLDVSMEIYLTMVFEDTVYKVKMGAGFIASYLAIGVAYINGTYIKRRLGLEAVELSQMKRCIFQAV